MRNLAWESVGSEVAEAARSTLEVVWRLPNHPMGSASDQENGTDRRSDGTSRVYISVVMPCLNEANTIANTVQTARAGCEAFLRMSRSCGSNREASQPYPLETTGEYEIIVGDNGSSDGSGAIARQHGATVIDILERGYGAALRGAIAAANGKYVVMGDSDQSYDFGEIPRFIKALEQGADLVVGNRFAGQILPGAMPWHHRYIGNPILSGLGRLIYGSSCRDWHCGLRAFDRQRFLQLPIAGTGMEFASEMIIHAILGEQSIAEIPINLYPDGRGRPPHLRSFRDGVRHLRILLKPGHLIRGLLHRWKTVRKRVAE